MFKQIEQLIFYPKVSKAEFFVPIATKNGLSALLPKTLR